MKKQILNTGTRIVRGKVKKVHFYNPQNGWAAFVVHIFKTEQDEDLPNDLHCAGVIPEISVGETLALQGTVEDSKYGRQMKVTGYTDDSTLSADASPEEVLAFLKSGCLKGIGPVTADRIFDLFGANSLNIIENDYMQLVRVKGISENKAKKIHDNYKVDSGVRKIVSGLLQFGISTNLAFRLFNKWGISAIDKVKANPYEMADPEDGIEGVGFKRADEVAMNMGIELNSPLRLQSLIVYLLMQGSLNGNIYYTYEELLRVGEEYLVGIRPEEVRQNLDILKDTGKVIVENGRIYAVSYYMMEKYNAEKLVTLHQAYVKPCKFDIEAIETKLGGVEYDEEQKEAIEIASYDTTGVMVLTGGPGVGKTTVTKGIIEMFEESGYRVYCAAPTGRAAKRMYEATGHKAYTIHRLLGCKGEMMFTKNKDHPLKCDAVIVDESSMIDNALMYRLLQAIQEGTKLVLVGDIDQLPSVGAGNILRDMINSKFFPVAALKTIHRQGKESMIVSNAHAINEGRSIRTRRTEDTDCVFVDSNKLCEAAPEWSTMDQTDKKVKSALESKVTMEKIVSLVTKEIPDKYGYDPKDIQVLIPMRKSPVGVNSVNEELQKVLNTSKVKVATQTGKFYVGDKVMQIRNDAKKGVFNGDIGIVSSISDENKELVVRFPNSDPTIFDNFIEVAYDFRELDELNLAYACTIHKSQGSEYPAIVMVVSYQHYIMLQRNLIYTGITRAKKLCYIVGTEKAIFHASNNVPVQHRNTTLIDRMYEFIEKLQRGQEDGSLPGFIESDNKEEYEYENSSLFD